MVKPEHAAKKKPSSPRAMYLEGCAVAATMPLVVALLLMSLTSLNDAIQILLSKSGQNRGDVGALILIALCGVVLGLALRRELRRLYTMYQRTRGIQDEQRRTAKLAERDPTRLELPESQVDTVTLPDDELRQQRGK